MIFPCGHASVMGIAGDPTGLVAFGAHRLCRCSRGGRSAHCCSPTSFVPTRRGPIRLLREAGVARIVTVTGDRAAAAQAIGAALGILRRGAGRPRALRQGRCRASRTAATSNRHGRRRHERCSSAASADVGIALGARGASTSSEAADVVILADRFDRVGEAIVLAQRARRIAIESTLPGWDFQRSRCSRLSSVG